MARVVVIGAGMAGSTAALLLANDGHDVTVLERDPAPVPGSADEAWDRWERRGVNQFRMLHYFLSKFRELVEAELPEVVAELDRDGALRQNPLYDMPEQMRGPLRADDDRFGVLTGRRPMVEAAIGRVVQANPGITVRRGVGVLGLVTGAPVNGVPHVTGVRTDDGNELLADIVIDAGGRRSALPTLLTEIGAPSPIEERADCGFIYYGRYFRSTSGELPPAFGPPLQPYGSVSALALPADNGTWAVGLITSAKDTAARSASRVEVWEKVIGSFPLLAHWLQGEPLGDVAVMAKIEDRYRQFVVDGAPLVTGVLALGDSWACTNPSVGRGSSIALMHSVALRDTLREVGVADPYALALRWHDVSEQQIGPFVQDTLSFDRHRLAEIDAAIEGRPYETDDLTWGFGQALERAAMKDPDALRAYMGVGNLLERGVDVFARPGMADTALSLGLEPAPLPGPSRDELLALLAV
jgi:flavin-dependent dehydrogenase